jgi:hypothetical protein
MSEPRLDDDIALGLDEVCEECDNGTDQPCGSCGAYEADTIEEAHFEK